MSLKQISKSKFYSYNVQVDPTASSFGKETSWFADDKSNLIATLIVDNYDKDWNYIIFALDSDGEYRAIDLEVSLQLEGLTFNTLSQKQIDENKNSYNWVDIVASIFVICIVAWVMLYFNGK